MKAGTEESAGFEAVHLFEEEEVIKRPKSNITFRGQTNRSKMSSNYLSAESSRNQTIRSQTERSMMNKSRNFTFRSGKSGHSGNTENIYQFKNEKSIFKILKILL